MAHPEETQGESRRPLKSKTDYQRDTQEFERQRFLDESKRELERLKGKWRIQTLLKANHRTLLHQVLQHLAIRPTAGVRWIVDIDPFNMI